MLDVGRFITLQHRNTEDMVVYNVTTLVEGPLGDAWLEWMQRIHIPGLMETGCFTGHRLLRLLEADETEGRTFTLQLDCRGMADFDRYREEHTTRLRQSSEDRWGEAAVSFRTLMEVIN